MYIYIVSPKEKEELKKKQDSICYLFSFFYCLSVWCYYVIWNIYYSARLFFVWAMAKVLYSTFGFCFSKICFLNKNITSYLLAQLECSIRSLFLLYSIYGKDLRDAQLCFFTNLLTTKINKDQFDDDWFESSNRPKIYLRNEDISRICYMALSLGLFYFISFRSKQFLLGPFIVSRSFTLT